MTRKFFSLWALLGLLFGGTGASALAQSSSAPDSESSLNYRLSVRDLVRFSVQDEPETLVEQRIDGQGRVRVPYIGNIVVAGLSVREAEELIEKTYIESFIYKNLQATLRVLEYSQKEVSVLGQVKKPGKVVFPIETNRLDIVEVVTEAGGFTNIARSAEVRVTRSGAGGLEEVFTVNVQRMLTGRGEGAGSFFVQPGDVIFVPERFF